MQPLLRSALGIALALIMGTAACFGHCNTGINLVSETAGVTRATDPRSIKASLWSANSTAYIHAHINSIPAGADIQVDGAYVGTTPSDIDLTCCWHDVAIIKPGRKRWTRRVRMTGGILKITAHLQKCARNSCLKSGTTRGYPPARRDS
jgi:hypothetical protein